MQCRTTSIDILFRIFNENTWYENWKHCSNLILLPINTESMAFLDMMNTFLLSFLSDMTHVCHGRTCKMNLQNGLQNINLCDMTCIKYSNVYTIAAKIDFMFCNIQNETKFFIFQVLNN